MGQADSAAHKADCEKSLGFTGYRYRSALGGLTQHIGRHIERLSWPVALKWEWNVSTKAEMSHSMTEDQAATRKRA
jgi:hypothetical protein